MIDTLIAAIAIAIGAYGFYRRTDATAGSLLAVLLFCAPITMTLSGKGMVLSVMGAAEFVLCVCMTACWVRWVSHRARFVLGCSIVKFLLVCSLAFSPAPDLAWMNTMTMINALLLAQLIVAGGMGDAVVWLLDRLDPASARDRDLRADRVGT